ncbi:unnamed protein product [Prorocentrum cordatum]|uniref:Membrane transport protein MMPL domain-containing protein n=1 Tax=Prorocentrum cordatum TaxID=2364126 RepID=A0ABN9RH03_9DINO|nr:unnamed protein product [Polarella glacialis]
MRFAEERDCSIEARVRVLLFSTSHTIAVSAALCMIVLLFSWLLPVLNLAIGSSSAAIGLAVCVCVHLTFIPACLAVADMRPMGAPAELWPMLLQGGTAALHTDRPLERAVLVAHCPLHSVEANGRHGRRCDDLHAAGIGSVCDATRIRQLHAATIRFAQLASVAYVGRLFSWGLHLRDKKPYMLTIHAPPDKLLDASGYHAASDLHMDLRAIKDISYIMSPYQWLNNSITWDMVTTLKTSYNPLYYNRRKHYDHLLEITSNGDVALAMVYTKFAPHGYRASEWVMQVRAVLSAWELRHRGYSALLGGGASEATDVRLAVEGAMPRYYFSVVFGIALIMFAAFRSIVLPLRLAFALMLSIAVTWGVSVLVFQTTLLHWAIPHLRHVGGIDSTVVPLATGCAAGLGLDYDVFLVGRVIEYRQKGFTNAEAVARGVSKTGSMISGAGAIMSLAFSALFLFKKVLLHQFGCILVVSVLLDAYLMRTVLVPALMLAAGEWNWWPREMPEPTRDGTADDSSDAGCEQAPEDGGALSDHSRDSQGSNAALVPKPEAGPVPSVVGRSGSAARSRSAKSPA